MKSLLPSALLGARAPAIPSRVARFLAAARRHWTGGGVVFGPHPRSYAKKVNSKVVKLAMRSALSAKLADGELTVVENLEFEKPSTKQAKAMLAAWGLTGRTMLVIDSGDVNTYLSFRNLPKVSIFGVSEVNARFLIDNGALLMTADVAKQLEEVLA